MVTGVKLRDAGTTLVELAVGIAVGALLCVAIATTLISVTRSSSKAVDMVDSLDDARLMLNQVQRDLLGSRQLATCVEPGGEPGSCMMLVVQTPSGANQLVRYKADGTQLRREIDDGSGAFPAKHVVSERVINSQQNPHRPIFVCAASGSLLQVEVTLVMAAGASSHEIGTVVRPRNGYYPPSC